MKYDKHGFLTAEWAAENIGGFSEMDPCCQQLQILFPDIPHRCSDIIKETPPVYLLDFSQSGSHANVAGGALAGATLAAIPSGGGSLAVRYQSVPEPMPGLMIAIGLSLLILRLRTSSSRRRPG